MQHKALILILWLKCVISFSQNDSVMYNKDLSLGDRIYLTYEDFRRNNFITKDQVISREDKDQLEFLSKVLFAPKFSYKVKDEIVTIESKNVWGYLQNNTVYVNYKDDFYRIPVFGSISYLVANVIVVNPGFYDPRFGYSTGSTTTKELREFLMNFYDGKISEFTLEYAQELLSRDKELFTEYGKLGHRKQKEQIYGFIRKFNALHPVYFLKM